MIKTMSPLELKAKLEQGDVFLIDVREPAEYRSECIESACLIPLQDLSIEKIPSKSRPIVIHCHSGRRSADACQRLLNQDESLEVYSLEGGIVAWHKAGFNTKKSGSQVLPLDRQTQLAAGVLAFTGTVLGLSVHSYFYILPGFVGLGLMFSGLTGWCGMAKLLARMPWNN